MDVSKLTKQVGKLISDNAPAILTTLGVMGVVSTAITAGRAGIESSNILRKAQKKKAEPLTTTEKISLVWPHYVPVVLSAGAAAACIIGAHSVNAKRQAALIGMYTMLETGFQEYKDKTRELTTGPKETKIRDEIAQDRVNRNPASSNEVIITGHGDVLCFDKLSGRYFEADMETLRRAQNDINEILLRHDYASLNDFYRYIGLPPNGIGNEFGWTSERLLELDYSTVLSEDMRPCISVEFRVQPIRNFHKFG